MILSEKQRIFTRLVAKLIEYAYSQGIECTFGETYRPMETAALYAKQGKGIKNSLHCDRLAVDLNLFKDNKYLADGPEYKILGEYWESLGGPLFQTFWGGRFSDPGHYSIGDNGRK